MRLRAEIWYEGRAFFERKDVRIDDSIDRELLEKFVEELVQVEQKIMSNGKVDLESKEDMRRRGVKSPNMADALMLTFAMGGAVQVGSYRSDGWGKIDTGAYRAPHVV